MPIYDKTWEVKLAQAWLTGNGDDRVRKKRLRATLKEMLYTPSVSDSSIVISVTVLAEERKVFWGTADTELLVRTVSDARRHKLLVLLSSSIIRPIRKAVYAYSPDPVFYELLEQLALKDPLTFDFALDARLDKNSAPLKPDVGFLKVAVNTLNKNRLKNLIEKYGELAPEVLQVLSQSLNRTTRLLAVEEIGKVSPGSSSKSAKKV